MSDITVEDLIVRDSKVMVDPYICTISNSFEMDIYNLRYYSDFSKLGLDFSNCEMVYLNGFKIDDGLM